MLGEDLPFFCDECCHLRIDLLTAGGVFLQDTAADALDAQETDGTGDLLQPRDLLMELFYSGVAFGLLLRA